VKALATIRALLRPGRFGADVTILASTNTAAQAINAGAVLVLARLATPADFGALALFLAGVYTVLPLASLRYENAIMLPASQREAVQVMGAALCILTLTVVAAAVVTAAAANLIVHLAGAPAQHLLPYIPLGIGTLGLYQIMAVWHARKKQFLRLGGARTVIASLVAGLQILFLLLGFRGGFSLVCGWLVGQAAGTALLAGPVLWSERAALRSAWRPRQLRTSLHAHRRFPLFTAPYSFIGSAAQQLLVVALKVFTSTSVVGLFAMASRLVSLPAALITTAMNQVFFQKLAAEFRRGKQEAFVAQLMGAMLMLGIPAVVYFGFEAHPLMSWALGARWGAASGFAAVLSVMAYFDFCTGWLDRIFDVCGKQHRALAWVSGRTAVTLSGFWLLLAFNGSAMASVTVFVLLDLASGLVWLWVAFRTAGFRLRTLAPAVRRMCLAGVVTALLLAVLHTICGAATATVISTLVLVAVETGMLIYWVVPQVGTVADLPT
jgi:O-antigen/teichoic acid export membrane protein